MGQKFKFVVFSDVHLGHKLCSKKLFQRELIDRYKDRDDVYFIDLGDGCDMIVAQTGDKRFQASQVDERYLGVDAPVDLQIADYCEMLEPIKDRLLAICDSNHHLTILKKCGTDPTKRIGFSLWPDKADRRLLGYSGFLVTQFRYETGGRTRTLVWSLTHGIGTGGKTEGGFVTTLGHDASFYDCDIAAYGHNHQLDSWDRIVIGVDGNYSKIASKKKIRINSGSFLKAYSDDTSTSYAEQSRFRPNALGFMEVNVKLERNGLETYCVKRMFL